MSSRSLIKFGKNSFVLSIPKSWIDRNRLKKGDEISVEESNDTLILSANTNENTSELKIKRISCEDSVDVGRNIIASYMNNYSIIEVYGSKLKEHIKQIEEVTHNLVALEIMESTSKKIVIKDFLNTQDISVESIIKRMDVIIRAMFGEIQESIERKEKIEINKMDVDVNRLYYVGYKILNKLLDKPGLSKSLNINIKDVMFYSSVIDSLEKIADQQKRFIRCINNINDKAVTKTHLLKTYDIIIKRYLTVIKAFYKLDKIDAEGIYSSSKDTLDNIEKIIDKYINNLKEVKDIHNTSEAVEKLRRFENNTTQIAKIIINKE